MNNKQLYYQCRRCFYNTCKKTDMKRHLSKKIKCYRLVESYKIKDTDIEELSLTPIFSDEIKNIDQLLSNNIINSSTNFNNIEEYVDFIDKNNETKCIYCNKIFFRKYELKRHVISSCKKKNIIIKNNNNDITVDDNIDNISRSNITINNNQQINNIQINLFNNKNVINSFDNDWDVTDIDLQKKILLFLADNKYSKTMEEILKNKKNLNILFDKSSDTGLVYKNDIDKFINMKSDDIIISIIYKLYSHLINFYEDIKNNDFIKDLDIHKDKIKEKYTDFNNIQNKNIKNYVKNILIDIFDKYKDKITEQFLEFDKYILTEKEIGF
jgi:hypothetical protein